MTRPPTLEIKFFGTHIRAEGIAGIVGAIMIVGISFAVYLGY